MTNLALGIGRASSLPPDDEHIVRARAIARTHCRVAGPVLRSERSRKRL